MKRISWFSLIVITLLILSGCPDIVNPPSETYSVIYDGNGYNAGVVPTDNNNYEEGESVTVVDAGTMSRMGFSFISWNTEPYGNGAMRAVGTTFVIQTANVTLYAQWTALPTYEIEFYASSEGSTMDIDYSVGGVPVSQSNVTPPFYYTADVVEGSVVLLRVEPADPSDHVNGFISVDGKLIGGSSITGTPIDRLDVVEASSFGSTVYTVELYASTDGATMDIDYSVGGVPVSQSNVTPPFYYTADVVEGSVVLLRVEPADPSDHVNGFISVDGKLIGGSSITGTPIDRLDVVEASSFGSTTYTIDLSAATDGVNMDISYAVGGDIIELTGITSPWSESVATVNEGTVIVLHIVSAAPTDSVSADVQLDSSSIAGGSDFGTIDVITHAQP